MNTSKVGNYYKLKTKAWLEEKGFQIATMEKYRRVFSDGKVIMIKQDQFASDLLAVNDKEIIFVQVKYNRGRKSNNVAEAIKNFHKFTFPDFVKKWIVVWGYREREPEIIEC